MGRHTLEGTTVDDANPLSVAIEQFDASDPLSVNVENTVDTVPALPSGVPGRTRVAVVDAVRTASGQIYDVGAGKTLYVTDIIITVRNISTTAAGDLRLRDGAAGADRMAVGVPSGVVGAVSPMREITHQFAEPLQFSDSVHVIENAGDLVVSTTLTGFEA